MISTIATPILFRSNDGYRSELLYAIGRAHRRILLETMVLDQAGAMDDVLSACLRAQQRGVSVFVVYDIYAHGEILFTRGLASLRRFKARLRELEASGAMIQRVGRRQLNPFAGRHHARAVLIDERAYIGGGVNLTGSSFDSYDFMLRYDSVTLTDVLYDLLPTKALSRDADALLYADETTEVLLDAGTKGQSMIYQRTCQLAAQATKVWYVSKLAPDGQLARILRSKDTKYWYNSLASAGLFDKLAIFIDQIKLKAPNGYVRTGLLHAKFCVFQMPNGTYQAVTGSHNFNSRGVAFGTQELAVHTKDQALCERLIVFAAALSVVR